MKKIKLEEVKSSFPLTVQQAQMIVRKKPKKEKALLAKAYQSDDVNSQQLYKPISKIIHFR